jgi:hypothetical protein
MMLVENCRCLGLSAGGIRNETESTGQVMVRRGGEHLAAFTTWTSSFPLQTMMQAFGVGGSISHIYRVYSLQPS